MDKSEPKTPQVALVQIAQEKGPHEMRIAALGEIVNEFGRDETGKGLATYGLVISGILIFAGIVYGIFMYPSSFGNAKPASGMAATNCLPGKLHGKPSLTTSRFFITEIG